MKQTLIYILTDREVVNGRIEESGDEPSTNNFRIAKGQRFGNKIQYELLEEVKGMPLPSETMFNDVFRELKGRGDARAMFYIHGYGNTLSRTFDNATTLLDNYPHDVLIIHAWSSHGSVIGQYDEDSADAADTGANLARAYQKLLSYLIYSKADCMGEINIFAHSMGNQALQSMVEGIKNKRLLFSNILMLHADVDWDIFSEPTPKDSKPMRDINLLAMNTWIVINKRDKVTGWMSHRFKNKKRRLANGVQEPNNLPESVEIIDTTSHESDTTKDKLLKHWPAFSSKQSVRVINGKL